MYAFFYLYMFTSYHKPRIDLVIIFNFVLVNNLENFKFNKKFI